MPAVNLEHLSDRLLQYGLEVIGRSIAQQRRLSAVTLKRLFRANFGVGVEAATEAFHDLSAFIEALNMWCFLLSLYWLKVYPTEDQMYSLFGRDKETMRNKIKQYVDSLADLKSWKIAWKNLNELEEDFVLSVDGVHFRINEPRKNPSANWCSHKHRSAGLGYEIGILIWRNQVVWAEGPVQAATHDKTKYEEKNGLQSLIPNGKLVVGDRGYRGEDLSSRQRSLSIRNTRDSEEVKAFKRRVRARHENFNARLKNFAILDNRFRHGVDRHRAVFDAVCVLCQYDMENGHPLFDV